MKRLKNRRRLELLESRQLLSVSDLLISEFMAANDDTLRDEDGDTSDWLEIYNNSDNAVSLDGLVLADSVDQWTLPDVTLEPRQFQLIFASGKDRRVGELHTNFKLTANGERLQLVNTDGTPIHGYSNYPFQSPDRSYGVAMSTGDDETLLPSRAEASYHVPTDDSLGLSWVEPDFDDGDWDRGQTGIGYERSGSNYAPLLRSTVPNGTVGFYTRIEFDAAELESVDSLTLKMKYDDGFVAYLNGTRVADGNGVRQPRFDSTSSSENPDADAVRFEDFEISQFANLLRPTGNVLAVHSLNRNSGSSDLLMLPELAFSRVVSVDASDVGFFRTPSPSFSNSATSAGFVAPVTIELPHGFYDQPQQVTITTADASAEIRYTTDGSPPTEETGVAYESPITVDSTTVLRAAAFKQGFTPSEVATSTYIFVSDIADQSRQATLDAGFPSSWNGTSPDYGIDPDIIGPNDDYGGKYTNALADSLTSIPTLSISLSNEALFGDDGIYSNPQDSSLEEAASLELIHPDGTQGFQINAGLKIQGGAFRSFGKTKKKSFRFKFQKQYGDEKLNYPLFGDNATTSFDTVTLRMEANDGWQSNSQMFMNRLYSRDEFSRRTHLAMGQPASHGTHTHVYLNGLYWGTYNVVERPDEGFASDYIGGDKEDWDIQNAGKAINGDLDSWREMLRLAREVGDARNGSDAQLAAWNRLQRLNPDGTNNPDLEDYLDVENYIDYMIVNMYSGNTDWPHHNYYLGRQRGPDSTGFKFFIWDAETSLTLKNTVTTDRTNISGNVAEPYAILRDVPEFQLWFADRIQKHFSPGGALYVNPDQPDWNPDSPEDNVPASRMVEITNIIREPLIGESARWGDQHFSDPHTVDETWEPELQKLLDDYFPRRSAIVLQQFDAAGFGADVSTPSIEVANDSIVISADSGEIYYTLDGSDPRLSGDDLSPTAVRYDGSIPAGGDVLLRVRARLGNDWSALGEAELLADATPATTGTLAITEVHYNPRDAAEGELDLDNDEFEFIEVTNTSGQAIDLSDVKFVESEVDDDTQGVRFTFGSQTLAPGASLVIVENIEAFRSRYGDEVQVAQGSDLPMDPAGEYGGRLSNGGELLTLVDATGEIIQQFAYSDEWLPSTDGEGFSLESVDVAATSTQLNSPLSWRASAEVDGSPGRIPTPDGLPGDLNGDEVLNRADVELLYAAIAASSTDEQFDLTGDDTVDQDDVRFLIDELLGALPGDANLDGTVDFADFLVMSSNFGESREDITWLDGDMDGDGSVSFADFLLLSANFGNA